MRATAAVAAHDKDVNALAVSPNDALVVTASQDRTAKVLLPPCGRAFDGIVHKSHSPCPHDYQQSMI